tara:strand:+ start:250 stop:705 length:456 start_codon:yes stop_codon:yes gene_type:complete
MQELKFKKFKKETFIDSLNNQFKEEEEEKTNTKKKNKTPTKKQNTSKTELVNKTSQKVSKPKKKSQPTQKNIKKVEFKTIINTHILISNNHKKIALIRKAFKTNNSFPYKKEGPPSSVSQLFLLSSCKIIKNQIEHYFNLQSILIEYQNKS